MIKREKLIKKFVMGISVLDAYIGYTGYLNMNDINVISEQLLCDILNILYGVKLVNANGGNRNNPGYDLVDTTNRIIVQVTRTSLPEKVIDTLNTLSAGIDECELWIKHLKQIQVNKEKDIASYTQSVQEDEKALKDAIKRHHDIRGYRLQFMVITKSAELQRKYKGKSNKGYSCPRDISFNAKEDILDFVTLIDRVNMLSECEQDQKIMQQLEQLMESNSELFGCEDAEKKIFSSKIDDVILSYAQNYTQKLFRHRYEKGSQVTLSNLFVYPKMKTKEGESQEIVKIIANFLWNEEVNRILFIEGDAAIGKTSLISFLCYHFLQDDEIRKAVFLNCDLVCIRLRELDFTGKKVGDVLLQYLGLDSIETFKAQYMNCVIILDGADEMRMLEGTSGIKIEEIISAIRKIFSDNKIVITSRPHFIDIKSFENRNFGYESMELLHFDREMRKQWLDNYQKCNENIPETTKEYILTIDNKSAAGVADTPLALYLLVACNMRDELQGNTWALYHEIFKNSIINTDYNENFDDSLEHPIKEIENILYRIVCGIAFKMFQNIMQERYYITSNELKEVMTASKIKTEQFEVIGRCCVLCAYWKNYGNIGALEFYHNNIRDYFLAEYIYEYIDDWFTQNSYVNDEKFVESICSVLSYGYIYGTTWEQTFMFLYNKLHFIKKEKENHVVVKAELDTFKNIFSKILNGMKSVWMYDFPENSYQHRKNTIINLLLLARIYQEGYGTSKLDGPNRFWNSEKEKNQIARSSLLTDWAEMLSAKIKLVDRWVTIVQNCILDQMNFQKKWIEDANLDNSSFCNTNFTNTTLQNVSLKNANLTGAVFANAMLDSVDFTNAILEDVVFDHATLLNCVFEGTKFMSGSFEKTQITECIFRNASINNVNWLTTNMTKLEILNSCFKESNLQGVKVKQGLESGNRFIHCNLKKANMNKCEIVNVEFRSCCLDESFFTKATLINVGVEDTTCVKCKMNNTIIEGCTFQKVDFEDTTFAQSRIRDNRWNEIKMRNADFRKAIIHSDDYREIERTNALLAWAIENVE